MYSLCYLGLTSGTVYFLFFEIKAIVNFFLSLRPFIVHALMCTAVKQNRCLQSLVLMRMRGFLSIMVLMHHLVAAGKYCKQSAYYTHPLTVT